MLRPPARASHAALFALISTACTTPIMGSDVGTDVGVDAHTDVNAHVGVDAHIGDSLDAHVVELDTPTALPLDALALAMDGGADALTRDASTLDAARTFESVDAASVAAWRVSLPLSEPNGPLVMFPDGTISVASNVSAGGTGYLISTSGVRSDYTGHIGSLPVVFAPPSGQALLISGYGGGHHAYTQVGLRQWNRAEYGCCRTIGWSPMYAISDADGVGYGPVGGGNFAEVVASSGATPRTLAASLVHAGGIAGSVAIAYGMTDARVLRFRRSTLAIDWMVTVGLGGAPPRLFPVALTTDSVIAASTGTGPAAYVARLDLADGREVWNRPLEATMPPLVASDRVLLAARADGEPQLIALSLVDGTTVWTANVAAPIRDALLGDDGLVYAVLENGQLIAHEVSTGTLVRRWTGLPGPGECLLRNGRLLVFGGREIIAIPVEAIGYEPSAPWPVRFHDNRRTMDLASHRADR